MIDFEQFWNLYNHKVAKKAAMAAWSKLNEAQHEAVMAHLPDRLANDKQWCEWGTRPHPATFLNGERWKDEYEKCNGNHQAEGVMERLERIR